jgi:hypothetical protein
MTCHNDKIRTAGLALNKIDLFDIPSSSEIWEKVIRNLRARAMPPQGMPRPDKFASESFVSGIENTLDRVAALHSDPGHAAAHRWSALILGIARSVPFQMRTALQEGLAAANRIRWRAIS